MKTYKDYHNIVLGWYGSVFNPLVGSPLMNPLHPLTAYDHMADVAAQETRDVYKQLKYIQGLEAKLKGKTPDSAGVDQHDFEMLSRLKKDLGMKVNFKTATEKREEERAARAGYTPPAESS